ncbi:alpha/beta-hydrolase, partial [Suillus decipiens]
VYTPGNVVVATPSGGLPVVVWIHGGGYIFGAASLYDGADLIVDSNYGIITVVLQYRLGLFGFLPGEAVKEGGALNAGLLDQNYALQWVQAHISKFGGDPMKVTIWGQSAGAGSVIQHVVAQGGNTQPPLFRTAMTSSTFVASQYNYNDRIPEYGRERNKASLFIFGRSRAHTQTHSCGSSSDTLSCLRAIDVNTLQTLNYNISLDGFYGMIPFVPVVDGTFIVERPTVTLSKGRLNGKYLLAVVNTHEGNILVNQSTTMNVADFIRTIYPNFGPAQITEAAAMYQNMGSNVNQANNVMSDSFGERAWKKQGLFAIPPGLHGMDVGEYFTSYTYISGAASFYDGADLIMESNHGVITVVLQYRLGLFGFLAGEAIKEGGALNAGLLDQNYAFQWVQAHISHFGGDPTKVTIWGESAGASSVTQHIVAHGGNTQPPLFRAAMTSSMFLSSQYNYNDHTVQYGRERNKASPFTINIWPLPSQYPPHSCSSSSDTLSCVRAADVNTLQTLNYNTNLNGHHGTLTFVPVVDGTFIVEKPTVTLSKGRLNGNYLLAVVNSHEGNIFVNQSMTMNVADFIRTIFPNFGPAQITGAAAMYQDMGSNVNQANLVMGESFGERAWK